jgi:diadenosine tetraphosphate (Ap4A) HIT family hydrolase
MSFQLDERLKKDSTFVLDLGLSELRLHNNASFPWFILIPQRPNITEIVDLSKEDQLLLFHEITHLSSIIKDIINPYKLNIANLGNIVRQLHIHVIGRFEEDGAWPMPVWSSTVYSDYRDADKTALISSVKRAYSAVY